MFLSFFAHSHRMLQGKKTKTKAAPSSSMLANLLAAKLSVANGSAKPVGCAMQLG